MKILVTAIVVAPLMLIGVPPDPDRSIASDTPIQLAAAGDSTGDRDSYTQKAGEDIREWQQKLHDFLDEAQTKGMEAGNAAEKDLSQAWTKTEAASRELQAVGAEGWQAAKTSFEKASEELEEAWDKVRTRSK